MLMKMRFVRRIPTPTELKEEFPVDAKMREVKKARDLEIEKIFKGQSDKFLLIIGPCSADNESAVLDYMTRLAALQEKVKDRLFFIPRCYTNKPRTLGIGYKGMLHQPNPEGEEDMLAGIIAIRELHMRVVKETGFTCAEEMLYPDNHRYLSDLLSYVAVGARSVENQEHRLVASGTGIPAGMKNPTSGDLSVMINSIIAAQNPQNFIYRGWEVKTDGNPMAHAVLRGSVDKFGRTIPNYHYEDLRNLIDMFLAKPEIQNPSIIIDTNHSNSGKRPLEQIRIAKDVMNSRRMVPEVHKFVKGLMIESYLEDGAQKIGGGVYGKSITDPCLGWEKTERLVYDLADLV